MARAMALALGVPAVGVSTLIAYCGPMLDEPRPGVIAAVIDAGHGHVYFHLIDSKAKQIFSPRVVSLRDAVRAIGGSPARIVGDAAGLLAEEARRAGVEVDASAASRLSRHRRARPHRPCRRSRAMAGASALYQGARRAPAARRFHRSRRAMILSRWSCLTPPVAVRASSAQGVHGGRLRAHPRRRLRLSLERDGAGKPDRPTPPPLGAAALDPATAKLRGFVLSRLAADEAEILTIAVDPALRKAGVGRDLLRAHLSDGRRCGRVAPVPGSRREQRAGARALCPLPFREGRRASGLLQAARRQAGGGAGDAPRPVLTPCACGSQRG